MERVYTLTRQHLPLWSKVQIAFNARKWKNEKKILVENPKELMDIQKMVFDSN